MGLATGNQWKPFLGNFVAGQLLQDLAKRNDTIYDTPFSAGSRAALLASRGIVSLRVPEEWCGDVVIPKTIDGVETPITFLSFGDCSRYVWIEARFTVDPKAKSSHGDLRHFRARSPARSRRPSMTAEVP